MTTKTEYTFEELTEKFEGFEELKREQRRLEARFVDLKSRFDGQGGTLAESARWIETTMGEFETKLEKTLGKYKDLLSNLGAFDFGDRLGRLEEASTLQKAQFREMVDVLIVAQAKLKAEGHVKEEPGFFSKLLGKKVEKENSDE